jgi:hypothetical protein
MTIATFAPRFKRRADGGSGRPLTPASKLPPGFPAALFAGGIVMIGVFVLGIAIYKSLRNRARPAEAWKDESPNTANPSAFATASMQGVIEKLRNQEKELERLHRWKRNAPRNPSA